ncbi:sirohydrochlorin cobaltochelatase [Pseudodesulfovibrio sediminis]|uniref:Cobalt chelatase n=1 Tax=Pseudodesulfovibrio sediminis TaxID=2810563 RepID=A0ABN6EZJ2_9BACT|nr:sirohydrochlorin cobaltochelatase [Pseudodesulfovibrio sediminis]BCS90208.1 cobalt chelatase [Pseudodesulfovibrio sediminis]
MSFNRLPAVLLACALVLLLMTPALAGHGTDGPTKKAIVLAAFGTSYPSALESILNIQKKVQTANPDIPVKLAFTSSIIRDIWHERQGDPAWQKEHPGIPKTIMYVKSPLATVTELSDMGFKDISVQSLHVYSGEEFSDLKEMLIGLRSIRTVKSKNAPFERLRLGRPALGISGTVYPYTEDLKIAAKALKQDVDKAKKMNAALVYMGHGNDFYSTGAYAEFQREMQRTYEYPIFIACVEGFPDFNYMLTALKDAGKTAILLKPFMIVAGDHATNDMAGPEDDSWLQLLKKEKFTVTTDLQGLGMMDAWADIYVRHLKDAMGQTHLLP